MKFINYYHEPPSRPTSRVLKQYDNPDHKIAVWNAFVDAPFEGVQQDDFSILPRMIPASYFPVIEKTARQVTEFALRLITLPEAEVRAIVPKGPVRDFLINHLEVLRFRPDRLIGSFRFDMAIAGKPDKHHPPQLLEINEIGFDGLARSNFFQDTLLELMPDLKKRAISLDTAGAEIRNMRRFGPDIARLQYDCYNWDEENLRLAAHRLKSRLHLVSPSQFKCKVNHKDFPLLLKAPFKFKNGKIQIGNDIVPDIINMSFAFSLKDYLRDEAFYQQLIRSKTPQYGPFLTGLVASKTILILLSDTSLRKKLLGSSEALKFSALPAFSLDGHVDQVRSQASDYVIKHADGFGGQQVFMNQELLDHLKSIPPKRRHEWVVQQKTKLNMLDVNGILSRRKKAIADLGVFVHYDWQDGRFRHFEVGGLMSRATNRSLKVNVSSGGLQVAVLLDKSC